MSDQHTPLHEGMRHCPVCKHPNIFTGKDQRVGYPDTALCHYCRAPISISGKVIEIDPAVAMSPQSLADIFGVDVSVLLGPGEQR